MARSLERHNMKIVMYILLLFPWSAAGLFLLRLVRLQRKQASLREEELSSGD
jgi:hypothetical protein